MLLQSLFLPPFPGSNRRWVLPQAFPVFTGILFGFIQRYIFVIMRKMPGKTIGDHSFIDPLVGSHIIYICNRTFIPVLVPFDDLQSLAMTKITQSISADFIISLSTFGTVNTKHPHPYLTVIICQQIKGIPIDDLYCSARNNSISGLGFARRTTSAHS